MTHPNLAGIDAQTHAAWNGSSGRSWLEHQVRFDAMLGAYRDAVVEAAELNPGESVIDIGCGTGDTTIALASQVTVSGHTSGIDISTLLLGRAAERAQAARLAIDFVLGDAATYPFEAQSTDILCSRLGIMFFSDPVAAFANMHRTLKPHGRLAMLSWRGVDENEGALLPLQAARPFVKPSGPPSPDAPGPFSFGDRDRVKRILVDAGYKSITVEPFDAPLLFGEGNTVEEQISDAVSNAFHIGPLSRLLAQEPDDVHAAVCDALRQIYVAKLVPEGVMLSGGAWIITARA